MIDTGDAEPFLDPIDASLYHVSLSFSLFISFYLFSYLSLSRSLSPLLTSYNAIVGLLYVDRTTHELKVGSAEPGIRVKVQNRASLRR